MSKLFETEIKDLLEHRDDFQSGDGVYVVVNLVIHVGCGYCWFLSLLCGFLYRTSRFATLQKPTFSFFFYLSRENDQLGESQYESVNRVEAAKLLGSPKSKNNTRFQPTPENCEYAVVNKANKKVSS